MNGPCVCFGFAFGFSKLSSFTFLALCGGHLHCENPVVLSIFVFYVFLINVFQKLTFDAFKNTLMHTKSKPCYTTRTSLNIYRSLQKRLFGPPPPETNLHHLEVKLHHPMEASFMSSRPSLLHFFLAFLFKNCISFQQTEQFYIYRIKILLKYTPLTRRLLTFAFVVFLINVFQKMTFDGFKTTLMLTKCGPC